MASVDPKVAMLDTTRRRQGEAVEQLLDTVKGERRPETGIMKPGLLVQDGQGQRMILNWIDLIEVHVHRDIQDEAYLDLIFRQWNILVLGRNIDKLIPLIQQHATDLVVGASGSMDIDMVVVRRGQGCSVFGEGQHSMEAAPKDTRIAEQKAGRRFADEPGTTDDESDPVIEGGFIQDGFDEDRIRQILEGQGVTADGVADGGGDS